MSIKFSDGLEFETSDDLRIIEERDGFYVVGKGWLIPVAGQEEGKEVISKLMGRKHEER